MKTLRDIAQYLSLAAVVCIPALSAPPAARVPTPLLPIPPIQHPPREAIAQGDGRWVLAWQAHDAALIASLFADDGVEMGRGGTVTQGHAAIRTRFARLFGAIGPVQASRRTVDVWEMGSTVYEFGRYSYLFPQMSPGRKLNVSAGSYVTVWRKQADGRWLIHSDVTIAAR